MRQLRPENKPLPPPWYDSHRGGVSVVVENADAFAQVELWQHIIGVAQRQPYEDREVSLATRRVVLTLETAIYGVPARVIVFRVLRWQPETITLTLLFEFETFSQSQYEFLYL